MAMRKMILLAGLVLALAVFLPGRALSAKNGTNLPYKGSFTATTELNLLTGQLHFEATAAGTHVGSAYIVQDGYGIPGASGIQIFTSFVLTAANGDTQLGSCTGSVSTTATGAHLATSACTINGGTGRFEGASGHFIATSLSTSLTLVGTTMIGDSQGTIGGVMSWG
jgi:hypothetical protein